MAKKSYKAIEIEIRELVTGGRQNIYQISTRCVQLLNDSDNYAMAVGLKPDAVLDHLNGYLRDFAVDLESVVTLLQIFPNADQWDRPLLDLLKEAEAKVKASDTEEPLARTRRTVKLADLEEKERIIKERDLELAKVKAENERLVATNEKLTERVAKMEGQIQELRRREKEPVPA